jgi:UDP-N-acetylglucosamine:LPS N-acetylglucosamine transferase
MPKRFLILTGDAGFGHRSAAKSIKDALTELHEDDAQTWIVDPVLERRSPSFLKRTQTNYDHAVLDNQFMYRLTYNLSDSRPTSVVVEGTLAMLLFRTTQRLMTEIRPDTVISTHHMFNPSMGSYMTFEREKFPFFTVITDLADVHSLWFDPSPDRYFVANESVKKQALLNGVAEEKIFISGIPVDPRLAHPSRERTAQRKKMGIDPDLPALLLVGSRRVNGIYKSLEALENCPFHFQVILISGGDSELYQAVTSRGWKFPIHCEGYVQNMPDYFGCADMLITKAGGLVISEGLAAGLPLLLIDNLPGQEDGNVRGTRMP